MPLPAASLQTGVLTVSHLLSKGSFFSHVPGCSCWHLPAVRNSGQQCWSHSQLPSSITFRLPAAINSESTASLFTSTPFPCHRACSMSHSHHSSLGQAQKLLWAPPLQAHYWQGPQMASKPDGPGRLHVGVAALFQQVWQICSRLGSPVPRDPQESVIHGEGLCVLS